MEIPRRGFLDIMFVLFAQFLSGCSVSFSYPSTHSAIQEPAETTPLEEDSEGTARLESKIMAMVESDEFEEINQDINPRDLAQMIGGAYQAVTSESIADNENYMNLILALLYQEARFNSQRKIFGLITGGNTQGPMETNIDDIDGSRRLKIFGLTLPYNKAWALLSHGISQLDEKVRVYTPERQITDDNAKYIFADANAGKYACRIAAMQNMLNTELNLDEPLELDGDFGEKSLGALKELDRRERLGLTEMNYLEIKRISIMEGNSFILDPESLLQSDVYGRLKERYSYVDTPVVAQAKINRNFLSFLDVIFSGRPRNSEDYSQKAMKVYHQIQALGN